MTPARDTLLRAMPERQDVPYVLAVELPYPPTVNTLWRHVDGRTIKSAVGRAYHERCAVLTRASRNEPDTWQPSGPLCVSLQVYPPDRRRRDLDNVLKASLDGIAAGLDVDDSTIAELHVYRWPPEPRAAHLFVTVTPAAERLWERVPLTRSRRALLLGWDAPRVLAPSGGGA